MEKMDEILHYWFGAVEENAFPSEHRTSLWFNRDLAIDAEIKEKFYEDYIKAAKGEYVDWQKNPRGCLALILLFDQFTRHLYRDLPQLYDQDRQALNLCLKGIELEFDHRLSLMERAFFYFPLMHAESIEMQSLSVRVYEMLVNLSFPETQKIFEGFFKYAVLHEQIIAKFGRFPHRNEILGRKSTDEELEFLKKDLGSID